MVTQTVSPDLNKQPELHHYTHLEASSFDQSHKVNKKPSRKEHIVFQCAVKCTRWFIYYYFFWEYSCKLCVHEGN